MSNSPLSEIFYYEQYDRNISYFHHHSCFLIQSFTKSNLSRSAFSLQCKFELLARENDRTFNKLSLHVLNRFAKFLKENFQFNIHYNRISKNVKFLSQNNSIERAILLFKKNITIFKNCIITITLLKQFEATYSEKADLILIFRQRRIVFYKLL